MKKLALATLAVAFTLTAPLASLAQQKPATRNAVQQEQKQPKKQRWSKGGTLPQAQRNASIGRAELKRHKLNAPGKGQQWVRVDDQFLLIATGTGLIVGAANAQ